MTQFAVYASGEIVNPIFGTRIQTQLYLMFQNMSFPFQVHKEVGLKACEYTIKCILQHVSCNVRVKDLCTSDFPLLEEPLLSWKNPYWAVNTELARLR